MDFIKPISLFIGYRDPEKEDRLIPIASDDCFFCHWTPVCQNLRLRWVSRFQERWRLTTEDIPYIISELERFRLFLVSEKMQEDIAHQQLARISILTRELNEAAANIYAVAIIGSPFKSERRKTMFSGGEQPSRISNRTALHPTAFG